MFQKVILEDMGFELRLGTQAVTSLLSKKDLKTNKQTNNNKKLPFSPYPYPCIKTAHKCIFLTCSISIFSNLKRHPFLKNCNQLKKKGNKRLPLHIYR